MYIQKRGEIDTVSVRFDAEVFERPGSENNDGTMRKSPANTDADEGDVEREKSDQQKKVVNDAEAERPKVLPRMKRSIAGLWSGSSTWRMHHLF